MRAPALVLLGLLLLPLAAPAMAQSMTVAPSPPVRPGSVWTVMNTVEVVVQDNYAVVKVIADIANRGPDPEFPFQVRVPEDAFVTGLTITRDGQTFEARIEERAKAREEYEAWKAQEQTGGLVEKRRGTSVYAFLVNVAEFTNVRAVLTYERYLAADEGAYLLPLEAPVSGFGRDLGAAFDVLVQHTDGVTTAWGEPTAEASREGQGWRVRHHVGPRQGDEATPLTVGYTLNPTGAAGSLAAAVRDGQGFFAHRFRAPTEARQLPIDLVLVLDTSGSMSGLKMAQMQDAASQVVGMLNASDRLHLVFFSSDANAPWPGLLPAAPQVKQQAAREVQQAFAAGGTNIEAGLRRGFGAFDGVDFVLQDRLPMLVVLTDGQPSSGIADKPGLRALAKQANAHGASVFALAFGGDADWGLMAALAKDGNGTALRVPEGQGAEVDLRRFMTALTTPVLKDVRVAYDGAVEAQRRSAPILFAGSELLVVGTFQPALKALKGTVTAQGPDGPRSYPFEAAVGSAAAGSFLPRVVASQEIRRLQELIDAEGSRPEWVEGIVALAVRHGFVTDHTSLVLTLEPRAPGRGCGDCVMAMESATDAASADGLAAPRASSGASPAPGSQAPAQGTRGAWDASPAHPQGDAARTPGFESAMLLAGAAIAMALARRRRAA